MNLIFYPDKNIKLKGGSTKILKNQSVNCGNISQIGSNQTNFANLISAYFDNQTTINEKNILTLEYHQKDLGINSILLFDSFNLMDYDKSFHLILYEVNNQSDLLNVKNQVATELEGLQDRVQIMSIGNISQVKSKTEKSISSDISYLQSKKMSMEASDYFRSKGIFYCEVDSYNTIEKTFISLFDLLSLRLRKKTNELKFQPDFPTQLKMNPLNNTVIKKLFFNESIVKSSTKNEPIKESIENLNLGFKENGIKNDKQKKDIPRLNINNKYNDNNLKENSTDSLYYSCDENMTQKSTPNTFSPKIENIGNIKFNFNDHEKDKEKQNLKLDNDNQNEFNKLKRKDSNDKSEYEKLIHKNGKVDSTPINTNIKNKIPSPQKSYSNSRDKHYSNSRDKSPSESSKINGSSSKLVPNNSNVTDSEYIPSDMKNFDTLSPKINDSKFDKIYIVLIIQDHSNNYLFNANNKKDKLELIQKQVDTNKKIDNYKNQYLQQSKLLIVQSLGPELIDNVHEILMNLNFITSNYVQIENKLKINILTSQINYKVKNNKLSKNWVHKSKIDFMFEDQLNVDKFKFNFCNKANFIPQFKQKATNIFRFEVQIIKHDYENQNSESKSCSPVLNKNKPKTNDDQQFFETYQTFSPQYENEIINSIEKIDRNSISSKDQNGNEKYYSNSIQNNSLNLIKTEELPSGVKELFRQHSNNETIESPNDGKKQSEFSNQTKNVSFDPQLDVNNLSHHSNSPRHPNSKSTNQLKNPLSHRSDVSIDVNQPNIIANEISKIRKSLENQKNSSKNIRDETKKSIQKLLSSDPEFNMMDIGDGNLRSLYQPFDSNINTPIQNQNHDISHLKQETIVLKIQINENKIIQTDVQPKDSAIDIAQRILSSHPQLETEGNIDIKKLAVCVIKSYLKMTGTYVDINLINDDLFIKKILIDKKTFDQLINDNTVFEANYQNSPVLENKLRLNLKNTKIDSESSSPLSKSKTKKDFNNISPSFLKKLESIKKSRSNSPEQKQNKNNMFKNKPVISNLNIQSRFKQIEAKKFTNSKTNSKTNEIVKKKNEPQIHSINQSMSNLTGQLNKEKSSVKKQKKPEGKILFLIKIKLQNNEFGQITVRNGDSFKNLAKSFAEIHNLDKLNELNVEKILHDKQVEIRKESLLNKVV